MSKPLTPRAQSVFDFIIKYKINNDGLSPTLRDIIGGTDITSTSIASYYLGILEGVGLIYCNPNISRGIQVVGGKWTYEGNSNA